MWVHVNGKIVAEEDAVVSVFDRSFRYGDALFEAVLVRHGEMFRWPQHAARLERSAAILKISLPGGTEALKLAASELLKINQVTDAVIRIQISRGTGPRGYAPTGTEQTCVVISVHPAPERPAALATWKLIVSSFRIATRDPLAQLKTCSRLLQVMAAAEAREHGADEALLFNTDGHLTEGSTSNVFWIDRGCVCTPPLEVGLLPGVTRAVILEICESLGTPHAERNAGLDVLRSCEGIFLSFTSRGIVEADSLDGSPLKRSPVTARLQKEFEALLERECAATRS